RITHIFSNEYTKSSLEVNLNDSPESIWSKFRKGHKSAIRKAINSGISVTEHANKIEIEAFIRVYLDMCNDRGIKGHTEKEMVGICNYVIENKCGEIILAKDHGSEVIGGAIFAHQGVSVRYLLSAADPVRKDLPVTHLILFRAIEKSREAGFQYFDFWGYNHFADPDNQMFLINRFKKGFGGYFTFFMKKLNISLIPGGFVLFRIYNKVRQLKPSRRLYSLIKKKQVGKPELL
ncbi:MAG: peptidoglycan bridge formation glycyltransferase FemA/FemB family protein, partial [Bacteroidales bacterium]|nr:peptidoglycan bridge formation glycyltransferase FemA/FemB family protein [Bacteroidales bacterium]